MMFFNWRIRLAGSRVVAPIVALTMAAAACSGERAIAPVEPVNGSPLAPTSQLVLALEVNDANAPVGSLVTVAVRGDRAAGLLGGLQGRLAYDAGSLAFVGQDETIPTIINDADVGVLRFASLKATGLASRAAVLQFRVIKAGYMSSLRFDLEAAASLDGKFLVGGGFASAAGLSATARAASDLSVSAVSSGKLTLDALAEIAQPGFQRLRVSALPGENNVGQIYGDAKIDGVINVLDAFQAAATGVGAVAISAGTETSFTDNVVSANVRPGPAQNAAISLAGPCFPGYNDCSAAGLNNPSRTVDVTDALAIIQYNTVAGDAVIGQAIQGRKSTEIGAALPVVNVACPITTPTTWTKGSIYRLPAATGTQICEIQGTTLTVQAGVRIESPQNVLVVRRDARLLMLGTAQEPITMDCATNAVYTTTSGEGVPTAGCNGGIYVMGNAPINSGDAATCASAPGRSTGGICFQGEGATGVYGGDLPADDSGVLQYVRILNAGFIFSGTSERNSLTLNGVGSGTTVDHIYTDNGRDDGIEWFGGTVNVKYVVVSRNQDDGLDWTLGWRGKFQYGIVRTCGNGCDNGIEADNIAADQTQTPNKNAAPYASPQMYNVTVVGVGTVAANEGIQVRQATGGVLRNIAVFNMGTGFDIDNATDATAGTAGSTNPNIHCLFAGPQVAGQDSIRGSHWFFAGNAITSSTDASDPVIAGSCGDMQGGTVTTDGSNLEAQTVAAWPAGTYTAAVGSATDYLNSPLTTVPDFRPRGLLATAAAATPPNDGFFDTASPFVGGVRAGGIPWYAGWANSLRSSCVINGNTYSPCQ